MTDVKVATLNLFNKVGRWGERLPLVVGAHRSGSFRAAVAYWVAGGEIEQIKTFADLRRRLESWAGEYPDPREWRDAEGLAQREAEKIVRAMERRARERIAISLRRQKEAASLRLQRQLEHFPITRGHIRLQRNSFRIPLV